MHSVILDAIYVRNQCASGLRDREWIVKQIFRLADEKKWSPSQIAAIVGYAPQTVRKKLGKLESKPEGGKLNPAALDIMLALMGNVTHEQRGNLLGAAIATGTSTRLIARMTGTPLGTVLYQQRLAKKDEANDTDTKRQDGSVSHL